MERFLKILLLFLLIAICVVILSFLLMAVLGLFALGEMI